MVKKNTPSWRNVRTILADFDRAGLIREHMPSAERLYGEHIWWLRCEGGMDG